MFEHVDWWLRPLPRSPGMGEGGDWWSWPMGVTAQGIPRGCQGLFTPVSLGYPLSVFNENSTLNWTENFELCSSWKKNHPEIFISEFCLHPWENLHYASVNLQSWCFTNNSLGLPHAQSFSVCLSSWVCVVCVCFFLYVPVHLRFARCVFIVLFISPFSILKHTSIWKSFYTSRCLHDYNCSFNNFYTLFICEYIPIPYTHCLHTNVYLFLHPHKLK